MFNGEFYKQAKAYDIAFNGRDYNDECNFIETCFNKHSQVQHNNGGLRFLELCCGPAAHAREMAKRGWISSALDLSEDMVAYAKMKSDEAGLSVNCFCADMTDYKLDKPVHLAGNFTESITHLTENEQLIAHFRAVAANMVPGGIYIIETAHPRYFFPEDEANTWRQKEGALEAEITFGAPGDEYDPLAQRWEVTAKMALYEDGKLIASSDTKSRHRWLLLQEVKMLAQLSGVFEEPVFYGSLSMPLAELKAGSDSMIIVLKRK